MDDAAFHKQADAMLTALFDALDADATLEVEQDGDSVTIARDGKIWLLNKHGVAKQIWFASPVTGGWHFNFTQGKWQLTDGRELEAMLMGELQ